MKIILLNIILSASILLGCDSKSVLKPLAFKDRVAAKNYQILKEININNDLNSIYTIINEDYYKESNIYLSSKISDCSFRLKEEMPLVHFELVNGVYTFYIENSNCIKFSIFDKSNLSIGVERANMGYATISLMEIKSPFTEDNLISNVDYETYKNDINWAGKRFYWEDKLQSISDRKRIPYSGRFLIKAPPCSRYLERSSEQYLVKDANSRSSILFGIVYSSSSNTKEYKYKHINTIRPLTLCLK